MIEQSIEKLLEELKPIIDFKVKEVLPKHSTPELREDLCSAAVECLLQVLRTYDEDKPASLKTYFASALSNFLPKTLADLNGTAAIPSHWLTQSRAAQSYLLENPDLTVKDLKEILWDQALQQGLELNKDAADPTVAAHRWMIQTGRKAAIDNLDSAMLLSSRTLELRDFDLAAPEQELHQDFLEVESCKQILNQPLLHDATLYVTIEEQTQRETKPADALSRKGAALRRNKL